MSELDFSLVVLHHIICFVFGQFYNYYSVQTCDGIESKVKKIRRLKNHKLISSPDPQTEKDLVNLGLITGYVQIITLIRQTIVCVCTFNKRIDYHEPQCPTPTKQQEEKEKQRFIDF